MAKVAVKQVWNGDRLKRAGERAMRMAMNDVGRRLVKRSMRRAPVDTGFLRASIDASEARNIDRGRVRMEVYADADYAVYVERGARGRPARRFLVPDRSFTGRLIRRELQRKMSRI